MDFNIQYYIDDTDAWSISSNDSGQSTDSALSPMKSGD